MTEFLEFNCSACGQANLLDRAELPAEGAARTCQSCGVSLFVRREDTAEAGSSPAGLSVSALPASASGETERLGLHLRLATGAVERVSVEAIEHGVQAGRVLPWDLVSDDGQEFYRASDHPELQHYFVSSDFVTILRRRCVNHRSQSPAGTCQRCGRSYCAECIETLIQIKPRLCPACNGAVEAPDPRLTERPVWERIPEIARYPLDDGAWKTTLATGVAFWLAGRSIFTSPLYLLVLGLLLFVMADSAGGGKRLALGKNLDLGRLFRQTAPVGGFTLALAGLITAVQLLLSPTSRAFLWLPVTILFFAYYPMAAGLLLIERDKSKALKPRSVLKAILELKEEYLLAVLLLVGLSIAGVAAQTLFSFIPFLGGLLGAVALAYASIAQAHTVGALVYLHRERILGAIG